jgi:hypothetical protein
MARKDTSQEQGKIAAEVLNILNQDVVRTTVRDYLPGTPLIIELEPNTYRTIFAVPMRVTPKLTLQVCQRERPRRSPALRKLVSRLLFSHSPRPFVSVSSAL